MVIQFERLSDKAIEQMVLRFMVWFRIEVESGSGKYHLGESDYKRVEKHLREILKRGFIDAS